MLSFPSVLFLFVFLSHTQNQRYSNSWVSWDLIVTLMHCTLSACFMLALGERVTPVCSCQRCGCVAGSQENWVPPAVEYSRTWDIFGMLFKDLLWNLSLSESICVSRLNAFGFLYICVIILYTVTVTTHLWCNLKHLYYYFKKGTMRRSMSGRGKEKQSTRRSLTDVITLQMTAGWSRRDA